MLCSTCPFASKCFKTGQCVRHGVLALADQMVATIIEQIAASAQSEGVPLTVEEITRWVNMSLAMGLTDASERN